MPGMGDETEVEPQRPPALAVADVDEPAHPHAELARKVERGRQCARVLTDLGALDEGPDRGEENGRRETRGIDPRHVAQAPTDRMCRPWNCRNLPIHRARLATGRSRSIEREVPGA